MGIIITASKPFSVDRPYRQQRPSTSKIIFLSCEGSVTEEEYFEIISRIFDGIKNKIQIVSVAEDEVHTRANARTQEQNRVLGKNKPKQLVERIEQFKREKEKIYQFSEYPEDEFWIVADIDQNTDETHIRDFKEALNTCDEKGYKYAISNPFFEMWLLLHHDEVRDEDKKFAVTQKHIYEATNYYKERMKDLGVPMYGNDSKHIQAIHYNLQKVKNATERARKLHIDKTKKYPEYYATTVYMLMDRILDMLAQN